MHLLVFDRISINIHFIKEHFMHIISESYQWTHDRYIIVNQDSDIEYVKNILKQSYEKNLK